MALNSFIRASLHGEAWTVLSIAHPQPFPKGAGDEAPEEYKDAVAPIDDAYATAMLEGTDDFACHRFDLHQQGVAGIAQQVGGHEARTDVGKVDGQVLHVGQLDERLNVGVLEPFGGRIGGSYTDALGAGNGTDDGNVPGILLGCMALEIVEGKGDHAHESFPIGAGGAHFNVGVERGILIADATAVEVEVHASHFTDEALQTGGSVGVCHIQYSCFHLPFGKLGL